MVWWEYCMIFEATLDYVSRSNFCALRLGDMLREHQYIDLYGTG